LEPLKENSQPSSPPPRKRRKLTTRQKKLLQGIAKGLTNKEAALQAGFSPKNPDQSATQALELIESKAPDLFARHGLDDDSFIQNYLVPALNANETKYFAHEGRVKDSRTVKAWGPRTAMIALTARLKGMISDSGEGGNSSIKTVVLNAEFRPQITISASVPHVPGLNDAGTDS